MSECCSEQTKKNAAWFVTGVGTLLVFGALALYLVRTGRSEPVGGERAAFRKQQLIELKQANAAANDYALLKPDTSTYRLPVAKALEVMEAEWKDGNAAGRAKLLERFKKSTEVPTFE